MIVGKFVDDERIVVPFTLLTPDGDEKEFEATLDTGFVGSLLLPIDWVQRMELPRISQDLVLLADGTLTRLPTYQATLLWGEKETLVEILAAPREFALVGIELLRGSTATFEFFAGGEIIIEEDA